MDALRSLEIFSRRDLLKGGAAASILPFGLGKKRQDNKNACPIQDAREKHFPTLVAVVRTQIDSLWCGRQGDSACQIANDVFVYASHLPPEIKLGFKYALVWLDVYSVKHSGRRLRHLKPAQVRRVLNQGETPRQKHSPPLISWDEDFLLHAAVAGIAMIGRLVLYSRTPARERVDLGWSKKCENADRLVSVPPPPLADLSQHYDVCVIGSGAGGATMANRLSAAGKRVLILDIGDYVAPDELVQKIPQADGTVKLCPPRGDQVLYRLYKYAGGQISGGVGKVDSKLDFVLPWRRKKIPPKQTITVCQAQVFGGGPYVNNAIHLPISREVYEKWGDRAPLGISYDQLRELMNSINEELGVSLNPTKNFVSARSLRFAEGCRALGEDVQPMPVSMRDDCLGCGSDNSVDGFGDHIGGVHPYDANGPNSFLMQAMNNRQPAAASYRTAARRMSIGRDEDKSLRVEGLEVCRVEDSGRRTYATIRADEYVVAAGIGASTRLVGDSMRAAGLRNRNLGKRLSANVGTAIYAMYDKPIYHSGCEHSEPGVTQCFVVDRRMIDEGGKMVEEPILENWFHFPGTVALALAGWFQHSACVMKKFNHLSMAGIVVPTHVRCSNYVDACGKVHIELNRDEFELLLRGMRRIARIYFAAAKPDDGVTLHLPTKALLLRCGRPLQIRSMKDFEWALAQIRRRGPAFINLLTTHAQGGVGLGDVLDTRTFRVKTESQEVIENLTVCDSSIFPAGCEINPQLTLKALATLASAQIMARTGTPTVASPSDELPKPATEIRPAA